MSSSASKTFKLQFVKGDHAHANGTLRRRIVAVVNGENQAPENVTLDSWDARSRTAKRWSERFGLDLDTCVAELERVSKVAMSEAQQARGDGGNENWIRVSKLADDWLATLAPKYHRKAKAIYVESAGREVPVSRLWTLASDEVIDSVFKTQEGIELAKDSGKPTFQKLLGLFKDAAAMAAERIIKTLPELNSADAIDPTRDVEDLTAGIVSWLLESRTHRTDIGTPVSFTIWAWAWNVEPGDGWHRCHDLPVFARIDSTDGKVAIAAKGEFLKVAFRYESIRRLGTDLTNAGLAVTGNTLKCDSATWRAWRLTDKAIDAVAVRNGSEALP